MVNKIAAAEALRKAELAVQTTRFIRAIDSLKTLTKDFKLKPENVKSLQILTISGGTCIVAHVFGSSIIIGIIL